MILKAAQDSQVFMKMHRLRWSSGSKEEAKRSEQGLERERHGGKISKNQRSQWWGYL